MTKTASQPRPWYVNERECIDKANKFLRLLNQYKTDDVSKEALKTFTQLNISRVIFESNLIEGAGLSKGETRRVLLEHFPRIPTDFADFRESYNRNLLLGVVYKGQLRDLFRALTSHGIDAHRFIPSIIMENKSKKYREVIQHARAIARAEKYSLEYFISDFNEFFLRRAEEIIGSREKALATLKEFYDNLPKGDSYFNEAVNDMRKVHKRKKLLTEQKIRQIHIDLARGLMPRDANVDAGEYCIDNRIIGWEILFPPPILIKKCMKQFVAHANRLMQGRNSDDTSIFEIAARISYDFVAIHPFPDFNGRMSRIIMNMVLLSTGCQFPISIRGASKEKHRYFTALRRANFGHFEPLTCLIAMQVVKTIEELNRHFCMAGLKPIIKD